MDYYERMQRDQLLWEARQEDDFFRRQDGSTSMVHPRRHERFTVMDDEEFKAYAKEMEQGHDK